MTRLILATVLLVVWAHAARATLVTGSFVGIAADVSDRLLPTDAGPVPVPLPVQLGDSMTGSFSYDTALAGPGNAPGQFLFNAGARLTVVSDGIVAATAAGLPGFFAPITVNASGDAFQIIGSAPLATNPFGLLPKLSLLCATASCPPNGVLPTGTFPLGNFSDLDALWFSPSGDAVARFHITDLTVTAVPEPARLGVALLGIALVGAWARRWRPRALTRRRAVTAPACP